MTFSDSDSTTGLGGKDEGVSGGRDVAPLSTLFAGDDVSIEQGFEGLSADSFSVLMMNLPTSPMRAGPWNAHGSFELTNGIDFVSGATFDVNEPLKLVYEKVSFHGSGGVGTVLRGTFEGRQTFGNDLQHVLLKASTNRRNAPRARLIDPCDNPRNDCGVPAGLVEESDAPGSVRRSCRVRRGL